MSGLEILSLIVTIICLVSFSFVFTILFRSYYKNAEEGVNNGKEDLLLLQELVEEEEKKSSKWAQVKNVGGKIISYSLLALVVVFFGFSLAARISNSPLLFGETGTLVISSPSMSEKNTVNTYLWTYDLDDQLDTYDLIGVERIHSPEEIELYDIIAFRANDGRTIVHRVIDISEIDGEYFFRTKGDANRLEDAGDLYGDYLAYQDILAKYNEFRVPVIGVFVIFLQSGAGIATIFSLIYCYLMYGYFRKRLDKAIEERSEYLVSTLSFDAKDKETPAYIEEREEILYKGEKYLFVEGKFIEKSAVSEEEITRFTTSSEEEEKEETENFIQKLLHKFRKEDNQDEKE